MWDNFSHSGFLYMRLLDVLSSKLFLKEAFVCLLFPIMLAPRWALSAYDCLGPLLLSTLILSLTKGPHTLGMLPTPGFHFTPLIQGPGGY